MLAPNSEQVTFVSLQGERGMLPPPLEVDDALLPLLVDVPQPLDVVLVA